MRQVIGNVRNAGIIVMISPVTMLRAIPKLYLKRPVLDAPCCRGGFVLGLAAVVGGVMAPANTSGLDRGATKW